MTMRCTVLAMATGLIVMGSLANAAGTSTTEPCAVVSAAYASQIVVAPDSIPTIAASIAHDCLLSVPLGKEAAIELVDSIEPYLEWQTDSAYKADPPADYFYPGYDMFANLAAVRANLVADVYASEYAFQDDLYKTVFGPAHDGHFVYYPDLLTLIFTWNRPYSLVSISEDQSSLPEIKVYEDVISSPSTASVVTMINGINASTYLADTIYEASWNQDADSAFNSMFYSKAYVAAGLGLGYFQGGGRIRYIYQGDTTNVTFANGTEVTLENYAQIKVPLDGVTDGASMYEVFCSPLGYNPELETATSNETTTASNTTMPGYPAPVVITSDAVVAGYYLDGEGFEDVAVIVLLAFESESIPEFQAVCQTFFAQAVAAGKTKLVIDFQGNGGGYILQGYDFFRQLFPDVVQDGFSRWKESDSFLAVAEITNELLVDFDPYTSDDEELVGFYASWFNYRYDLNLTDDPFLTYEDKFSPFNYQDTNYTNIMRWNLNDNLTTVNDTFGMGIEISGYGSLANLTQPFAAENIIILYDGVCASTCTIASEMLRIQGGVKSIAMGGRPQEGAIQGVGGIKGSQVAEWSDVYEYNVFGLERGDSVGMTDGQKASLSRYSDLPVNRSSSAAVNVRDQILRDNVDDGLPAQYVAEYTDCRLYWTLPMITDVTAVWKAAADAAFNGAACAAGGISSSNSTAVRRNAVDARPERFVKPRPYTPRVGNKKRTLPTYTKRSLPQTKMFSSKNIVKAIP